MWKKIRGLLSDAAIYGSAGIVGQLAGFFLLPVYTLFLDPSDYGIIAMLMIFTTVYVPIANLGMTNAIFRRFNDSKKDEDRAVVLFSGSVTVLVSTFLIGSLCFLLAPQLTWALLGKDGNILFVRLCIVTAMMESLAAVPTVILRADRRVQTIAVASIARLLLTIGVTIVLVVYAKVGVLGVVVGNLCGSAFALIILGYLARHGFRPAFAKDVWWWMFKYGVPFVPHHVQMVGLVMVGQFMVRQMDGLAAAGMFNIALKFALPVAFVVNSIQKAWVPFKFQVHAEEEDSKKLFRITITYYFVTITYLWVGVSYWGPELLRLMTAPEFHPAAYFVAAAALVSATRGFRFMITTGMEFKDSMVSLPVISFVGLVVVVIASYLLIPIIGPNGAALGTSLGWILIGFLGFFVARKTYNVGYDWPMLIATAIVATLFVAVAQWSQHQLVLWQRLLLAVVASLAYPGGALALLLRSKEERARVLPYIEKAKSFFRRR